MDGFIVVDKPAGMTSHDVVHAVRRITGEKKAGHTGTLDPFATGVLPVALGEGTKAIQFLDESVKEYRAVMRLGQTTDTQDSTGTVVSGGDWSAVLPDDIVKVVAGFTGSISQIPPMYSALKHQGVPLYRLARRGAEIDREPRKIEIHYLGIDLIDLPDVAFTVGCSRGTYVRTLAHDMGAQLGCGAHLIRLQRTMSGPFALAEALPLDRLDHLAASGKLYDVIISPHDALAHLPDLLVNDAGAARVRNGIAPQMGDLLDTTHFLPGRGERVRISRERQLLAVAELNHESLPGMRLLRVFLNP